MIYKDRKGNIISAERLEELLQQDGYRIVGQEKINGYFVSTVWLGVGYDLGISFFETMAFKDSASWIISRYATEQEAIDGHIEVVTRIQEGWQPE